MQFVWDIFGGATTVRFVGQQRLRQEDVMARQVMVQLDEVMLGQLKEIVGGRLTALDEMVEEYTNMPVDAVRQLQREADQLRPLVALIQKSYVEVTS